MSTLHDVRKSISWDTAAQLMRTRNAPNMAARAQGHFVDEPCHAKLRSNLMTAETGLPENIVTALKRGNKVEAIKLVGLVTYYFFGSGG